MTKEPLDGERVYALRDFLTAEECAAHIARSETLAYELGTVGGATAEQFRNNDRVLVDDEALAESMFRRARPRLPASLDGDALVGFNERWRFYRYATGQTFKPHRDGAYHRFDQGQASGITFMIYLNDVAEGGETRFFTDMVQAFQGRPYLSVRPTAGTALVFLHDIWHEGAVVASGRKYVLRTDVMYGRAPASTR